MSTPAYTTHSCRKVWLNGAMGLFFGYSACIEGSQAVKERAPCKGMKSAHCLVLREYIDHRAREWSVDRECSE